jgi:hypothetical protein
MDLLPPSLPRGVADPPFLSPHSFLSLSLSLSLSARWLVGPQPPPSLLPGLLPWEGNVKPTRAAFPCLELSLFSLCQPSTLMQLNFAFGRGALVCQPASHANPIVSILSGHELAARRAHLRRARSGRARQGVAVFKNSRHILSCRSAGGACQLKEPRPPKAREGGIHRRDRTSRRCCDPQKPPTSSQGVSKSEDREEPQPG